MPSGEVLILAGDTWYLDRDYSKHPVIKSVAQQYEQVILIPGNHEYYSGYNFSEAGTSFVKEILPNVKMVNNTVLRVQEIDIICSTLWSKIERNPIGVMNGMADFDLIKKDGRKINYRDYNSAHSDCLSFIDKALSTAGKKIVVTHHLPSNICNAKEFANSMLNEAFCVDLTDMIYNSDASYWIYGHSHRNVEKKVLNETELITNQLGYVSYNEHMNYRNDAYVEI